MRPNRTRPPGISPKLVLIILSMIAAKIASAQPMEDPVLKLAVANDSGSCAAEIHLSDGAWSEEKQQFSWKLSAALSLKDADSGAVIATLNSATMFLSLGQKTKINLDASVTAGDSLTQVEIYPAVLSCADDLAYRARAKARFSATLTDKNNDGAVLSAIGDSDASISVFDHDGRAPLGQYFAGLLGRVLVGIGGKATVTGVDPPFGYRELDGAPTDASMQARFTLTAADTGVVSSRYETLLSYRGDMNCDSAVDFGDIDAFVVAIESQLSYELSFPSCDYLAGDMNGDGTVDFADLDAFVASLIS